MNGAAIQNGVGYSLGANWMLDSATSDFNGDGKNDLLWHNTATGNVGVWEMNGAAVQNGVGYSLGANWMLDTSI
jgi:outer membrane protein W